MTYALLNRDGSFRCWIDDPNMDTVRPGCVIPQSVDPMPDAPAGTVVEEAEPIRDGDVMRQTWKVTPRHPTGPVYVDALQFCDRITPAEWDAFEAMGAEYAEIRHALRRLNRAQQVDLLDPALPSLFEAAVAAGAIAADRVPAILGLP